MLLEKVITVGSNKYKIIGILEKKGPSMGFGGDKIASFPSSTQVVLQLSKSIFYH